MRRFRNLVANWRLRLKALVPIAEQIQYDVPLVVQFASPEYAERVLKDKVPKDSDPNWRETGAESPEEYARWVTTMCGMACTAMALQFFEQHTKPIVTLAKAALNSGVYKEEDGVYSAMHYREYVPWVADYGLYATVYSRLSIRGIQSLLSRGALVMVSVNPNIRGYDTAATDQTGGHLVLVTGYDIVADTITINNPSGFVSLNSQKAHIVSAKTFLKYFAGRGLAIRDQQGI